MQHQILDRIRVTIDEGIADVAMIRGERHNGMDFPMLKAMLAAQKLLRGRRDVRCAILHGDGPSFCAGLDFKSVMSNPRQAFALYLKLWWPFANAFQLFSLGWRKLPFPVIAAVHGNCFGAGMQLALGADIRIARGDAQLSIMETKWGLIPDMGAMVLLRELVPIDIAKELTMTSRIVSGTDAKTLGLITHLADDPLQAARMLADEIAIRSPDAVAASKFLLQRSWGKTEHGALVLERHYQRRIINKRNQKISVARNQKKSDSPFAPRRIDR